jgi:hypothetical protein
LSLLNVTYIASSTSVLLGGKTPGQYNGSLLNGRIKQDIVSGVKKKKAPAGNGVTGLSQTPNTLLLTYKLISIFRSVSSISRGMQQAC